METELSLKRTQRLGFIVVAILGLAIFGWAAQARIAGAIIAIGQVAVLSDAKPVQHLEGGIVASVHVQNGQRVDEGNLLVKLDDTQIRYIGVGESAEDLRPFHAEEFVDALFEQ